MIGFFALKYPRSDKYALPSLPIGTLDIAVRVVSNHIEPWNFYILLFGFITEKLLSEIEGEALRLSILGKVEGRVNAVQIFQ